MSGELDELLRALHDAHGTALFRYVARLTGDYTLAQDVVQEALLRAWKHPEILEQGDGPARAWLFAVARNLVIDAGPCSKIVTACPRRARRIAVARPPMPAPITIARGVCA